jgi:5-methylcytosine-specific restriction endonuclease McrA
MPDTRKYSDRAEYLKMAVKKRRHRIKLLSLEYKGNQCYICGYNRYAGAMEFHHLNAKTKKFGIAFKGAARSWYKTKLELDKCILLCSNCHKEIHAGQRSLPEQSGKEKRGELLEA